jgi:hypothetical protein
LVCSSRRVAAARIQPDQRYRVAFPTEVLGQFAAAARMAPRDYRHTDLDVGTALARYRDER